MCSSDLTANETANWRALFTSGLEDLDTDKGNLAGNSGTMSTGEFLKKYGGAAMGAGLGLLGFRYGRSKGKTGHREGWYYRDNKGNVDYHGN